MRAKALGVLAVLTFCAAVPVRAEGPKVDVSDFAVVLVSPSVASSSPANGLTCGLSAVTDPFVGPDVHTGVLKGGPLTAFGSTVSMRCSIQAGGGNSTHPGEDIRAAASAPTLGTTVLSPTPESYQWPFGQPIWLCTEITVDGRPSYWDADTGQWSASPQVSCAQAVNQEIVPGPVGVLQPVVQAVDEATVVLDTVVCPLLVGPLSPLWPVWVYIWHC